MQDPWTDVYALCATIYKCITGITPDDSAQRLYHDEVKAPSALGISIDGNIEAALLKGLAVRQKYRYQSIDELLDGFQADLLWTTKIRRFFLKMKYQRMMG